MLRLRAHVEIARTSKGFSDGLLLDLVEALRRTRPGELIALTSSTPSVGGDLDGWSRLTGNAIVGMTPEEDGATRWVIRHGAAPRPHAEDAPAADLRARLWLYVCFDCNLRCDYCCVRSTPTAARRELGLARVQRIAREAAALGVREIFVTGGEPLLLHDIADLLRACADEAPTTILTNGMLLKGERLDALRALPRDRVTFQISLDSSTPELHDLHRGAGTWARAWRGVEVARGEGFRVRLAATVSSEEEEQRFRAFLDTHRIAREDRVIRRIALRGFADVGVALSRADLVPEVTITAEGVYWHPVGADDDDMRVTREIFPLASAFDAVAEAFARERAIHETVASVFHCA